LAAEGALSRGENVPAAVRQDTEDESPADTGAELERILASFHLNRGAGRALGAREQAARELQELGTPLLSAVLERIASTPPTGDRSAEQRVMLQAFASFSFSQTRPVLGRAVEGATVEVREFILAFLAESGSARDLDLVDQMACITEIPTRLEVSLSHTLVRVLQRDRAAFIGLAPRIHELPARLRAPYVRAVGAAGTPEGMDVLFELLDAHEDLEEVLLDAIAELAEATGPILGDYRLFQLRKHLDPFFGDVRPQTLRAIGYLEDFESAAELIAFLEGDQLALRAAALDALRTMSGLSFGSDPQRWAAWYDAELRWWRERGHEVLGLALSDDPAEMIGALSEMLGHRLHKSRLLEPLGRLLSHHDPRIRRLACIGLSQFGSLQPVVPLRDCLDDVDEGVRAEARRALRILEGPHLTSSPERDPTRKNTRR
jgi:hypothetical protein